MKLTRDEWRALHVAAIVMLANEHDLSPGQEAALQSAADKLAEALNDIDALTHAYDAGEDERLTGWREDDRAAREEDAE